MDPNLSKRIMDAIQDQSQSDRAISHIGHIPCIKQVRLIDRLVTPDKIFPFLRIVAQTELKSKPAKIPGRAGLTKYFQGIVYNRLAIVRGNESQEWAGIIGPAFPLWRKEKGLIETHALGPIPTGISLANPFHPPGVLDIDGKSILHEVGADG